MSEIKYYSLIKPLSFFLRVRNVNIILMQRLSSLLKTVCFFSVYYLLSTSLNTSRQFKHSQKQSYFSARFLICCLSSSNKMYVFGGGIQGIYSWNNAYSSRFSIALFDRLPVALALALGCGRFNVGRAPSFNNLHLE